MKKINSKWSAAALACVAAAGAAFCIFRVCPARFYAGGLPEEAKVVRVIDGDTVEIADGRLVRYIGVDTPELRVKKNGQWQYEPQEFGVAAKKRNKELVEGKKVKLRYDVDKKDKYNRLLAYVYCGDVFVNAELIRGGYAQLYTFPPNVKHADLFVELQKEARRENRGFWGDIRDEDITPEEAKNYIGQVRSVKGKVLSIFKTKKVMFLNFGKNYKEDFTIVIFRNSFGSFEAEGIDPAEYYKGKTIRVTGRIKEYNGPEIIVNHPAEIEIK